MATQEKTWNVANRLHSLKDSDNPEVNHIIAGADDIYDDSKGAKQSDINAQTDVALDERYTKSETYSKEQLDSLITTPDVEYVTVATFADLPQTGEANTIYRVSFYDGTQVDASKYALYAWNGTSYQLLAVRSAVGEVFDVSEYNSGATYETLSAALAAVPASVQRGGMSIKFVQSSDNKYVQFRYMSSSTAVADFTNVDNWQGVDKEPTSRSKNLIESGGVKSVADSYFSKILSDDLALKTKKSVESTNRIGSSYLKRNGSVVLDSGTSFYVNEYPVNEDNLYRIAGSICNINNACLCVFYDSSNNVVGVDGIGIKSNIPYTSVIVAPSGSTMLRVQGRHSIQDAEVSTLITASTDIEKASIRAALGFGDGNIDSVPTRGSENVVKSGGVAAINDVINIHQSVNLFDKEKITPRKFISSSTHEPVAGANYFITDYIPIDSAGVYANNPATSSISVEQACYDANKQYTHSSSGSASKQMTYQQGDAYVRFTCLAADIDTIMIVRGTSEDCPTEYVPYCLTSELKNNVVGHNNLKDNCVGNNNIIDKAIQIEKISFADKEIVSNNLLNENDPDFKLADGYYINYKTGDTEHASSAASKTKGYTGFIPVSKKGLVFNAHVSAGVVIGAAVYDTQKGYLRKLLSANYTYQEGDGFVRWTLAASPVSPYEAGQYMVCEGTELLSYDVYNEKHVINKDVLPEDSGIVDIVDIYLPDKIYAVWGDVLQLFYQGMAKVFNSDCYNYLVSCGVGRQFRRYYEYNCGLTATLGEQTFKVVVRDKNKNILGAAESVLKVVKSPTSPSSNVNVLCLGDSITDGGEWPGEMKRRLTGVDGTPAGNNLSNIAFVGSITKNGVSFEGNSGYSWGDYATRGRAAFRFYIPSDATVSMNDVYSNNGHEYTVIEISYNGSIRCSTSSFSNTPNADYPLVKVSGSGDNEVEIVSAEEDSRNPFWNANKNSVILYVSEVSQVSVGSVYTQDNLSLTVVGVYIVDGSGYIHCDITGTGELSASGTITLNSGSGDDNEIGYSSYEDAKLDFVGYANSYCNGSIDAIYVLLGANGLFNVSNTNIKNAQKFIGTFHEQFPNGKVKVMGMYVPSMKLMMPGYGASGERYADTYNVLCALKDQNKVFQEFAKDVLYSGYVEYIDVACQLDSDYNFPMAQKDVNTRNSSHTEPYANNTLHCSPTSGYMQIADAAYRNFVGNFCQ